MARLLPIHFALWTCLIFRTSASASASPSPSTAVAVVADKDQASPLKHFGFLDDTGKGIAKVVETTSSGKITDSSTEDLDDELEHEFHQVSLKDSKWKHRRLMSHIKATLLTVLLAALMSPLMNHPAIHGDIDSSFLIVGRCFVSFLYLVECFLSSTHKYLSNSLSPMDLKRYLKELQQAPPTIRWHIECYHWRRVHRRDSNGRTTTSREKMVTHRACREFPLESWKDITSTASLERSIALDGNNGGTLRSTRKREGVTTFVKTTFSKLFVFSNPAAAARFMFEEAAFIASEGNYDVHHDFERRIHLRGQGQQEEDKDKKDFFRHKILVVRTGLSDVTFASQMWFWIASILGLTVPYRMWLSNHCHQAELTVTKTIDS